MQTKPRFSILTLGCKINQYETQALREAWLAKGYTETPDMADADLILVNSCAVTAKAVSDLRYQIRQTNRTNPDARIIITGCAAQLDNLGLEELPGVQEIVPQDRKRELTASNEDFSISDYTRARAVLKIQDGCSHFCTYCIVPHTRGPSRSRDPQAIFKETERLLDAGFREISISGVNLRHFGRELSENWDLWSLIDRLEDRFAADWAGKARFRLSSIEPAQLGERALASIANSRLLSPHLHLSLQSLSKPVLEKMNRGHYTPEQTQDFVENLRSIWPVFGLGADFICGFPGESETNFKETLQRAAELPLSYAHVFPYSPRPNTPAAKFGEQVPKTIRKERAAQLRALVANKKESFLKQLLEQEQLDVIVEHTKPTRGTSQFYTECQCLEEPARQSKKALLPCKPEDIDGETILVRPLK